MTSFDSTVSEPYSSSDADAPSVPSTNVWRSIRTLWCRHRQTIVTAKTDHMPAHVVCESCGWREPLLANAPQGTRTWDSSRDEARYQREKKRREAIAEQRQLVEARRATAAIEQRQARPARTRRNNIVELKRVVGE